MVWIIAQVHKDQFPASGSQHQMFQKQQQAERGKMSLSCPTQVISWALTIRDWCCWYAAWLGAQSFPLSLPVEPRLLASVT